MMLSPKSFMSISVTAPANAVNRYNSTFSGSAFGEHGGVRDEQGIADQRILPGTRT